MADKAMSRGTGAPVDVSVSPVSTHHVLLSDRKLAVGTH
jgi:hypothetical protein